MLIDENETKETTEIAFQQHYFFLVEWSTHYGRLISDKIIEAEEE